jgi:hypothetical protein
METWIWEYSRRRGGDRSQEAGVRRQETEGKRIVCGKTAGQPARDRNRSLRRVVGDLILQSSRGAKDASIKMSDYGFPIFRCARPVSSEDVKALDDEE